MTNIKEKLVELLMNSETEDIPNNDGFYVCHLDRYKAEFYADHLIANGVTVQECKAGDVVYQTDGTQVYESTVKREDCL